MRLPQCQGPPSNLCAGVTAPMLSAANSAFASLSEAIALANVAFCSTMRGGDTKPAVRVVAQRDITPGDELLADYGSDYFAEGSDFLEDGMQSSAVRS